MQFSKIRTSVLSVVLSLSMGYALAGSQIRTDVADVVAAQSTWTSANASNYNFTLTQYCFCPTRNALRIEVRDGVVQRASDVFTGKPVADSDLKRLPTLNGLFDLVMDGYKRHAAVVQVQINSQYSFPEKIFIDYDLRLADEEARYQVTDFSR